MNLLMLLSALLSALTSVGAAVRRPEVAQSVAQQVSARDVARTTVTIETFRPVSVLPTLRAIAPTGAATAFLIVPIVAPWASRRRE